MKKEINITEKNFLDEFRRGNESALSYIYDAYSGALYGILLRMTQNEQLAQDLLQECFVKIWRYHAKYDSSKGSIFTWMLNLTRNHCIDYMRSKRNKNQQKNRAMDSVVYQLHTDDNFNPNHIGVQEILKSLPDEQRKVIQLSYFEGYTQKEISEDFDIPLGTVKSRAKAALDKLRKIFNQDKR